MAINITCSDAATRWYVTFMVRSPADHVFVLYCIEEAPFPGDAPMERIDMWAEGRLMTMLKNLPEAQFSYRLTHY